MAEIGQTLREARMRAHIDISEVETRTKIRAKYLRAIENEEFDLLPGPIYVKSFLKTYGDYLGLDSRMLIDDYKRSYERPVDGELRPITPLGRERERERQRRNPLGGRSMPPWALIGAVIVVVVVVLYIVGSGNNTKSPTPTGLTTHHKTRRARHRRATTPRVVRRVRPKPATASLQMTPTSTVYVCLADGRGKLLIPGRTFTTGQSIPPATARTLLLTLGNASVTMKVNDKPIPLAASSTPLNYKLTAAGAQTIPATQGPHCV